ncbi:MAG TPA: FBP domain-containing protein [Candidatus Saccharimonadales bacterium]|nr:FBP domain-containing protein [Candidatus Saccharimonadales bacterium]
MKALSREEFAVLLKEQRVRPRLVQDLRFAPEEINDWEDLELLSVRTRSEAEGLLLIQLDSFYLLPYELTRGLRDTATGRSKPIICDFCYTWQQGGKISRITFHRASDDHRLSFLCCADLQCSRHIRNKTAESALSRTQLHEDITVAQRIERLKAKLQKLTGVLQAQAISHPSA